MTTNLKSAEKHLREWLQTHKPQIRAHTESHLENHPILTDLMRMSGFPADETVVLNFTSYARSQEIAKELMARGIQTMTWADPELGGHVLLAVQVGKENWIPKLNGPHNTDTNTITNYLQRLGIDVEPVTDDFLKKLQQQKVATHPDPENTETLYIKLKDHVKDADNALTLLKGAGFQAVQIDLDHELALGISRSHIGYLKAIQSISQLSRDDKNIHPGFL